MKTIYKTNAQLPSFVSSPKEEEIKKLIETKDFNFNIDISDKGLCYDNERIVSLEEKSTLEYSRTLYRISLPEVLDSAQITEYILFEDDEIFFHRVGVFRDGEYIDKLTDATIQVFSDEAQTIQGVFDNKQKINVRLMQVQIDDVILFEYTTKSVFSEKKVIRRDFQKYVFEIPTFGYWIYSHYKFTLLNNTNHDIFYTKKFFRDKDEKLIDFDITLLKEGEQYLFEEKMYSPVPVNNNYFTPFIDFSSCQDWQEVSTYLHNLYLPFYKNRTLKNDFPELHRKLEKLSSKEEQIQFAIEFVQNNIKYIYDANEMDGHLPQDPIITYNNRVGDCKAKSLLLNLILREIEVDSNIILVNYNLDPMLGSQLPSPLSFSHVLLKINRNQKIYFIDPTSNNLYGRLERRTQPFFRYFLNILPNSSLEKRPCEIESEYNSEESISVTISGNKVHLESKITFHKEAADNLRKNLFSGSNASFEMLIGDLLFAALDNPELTVEELVRNIKYKKIEDNKVENSITYEYTCDLENGCILVGKTEKVFKFYDRTFLNTFIQTYTHKDAQYFHDKRTSKLVLTITGDQFITRNALLTKELEISNKYFFYSLKKEISKKSMRVIVEINNILHDSIPLEDLKNLKEDYKKLEDNGNGVGVIFSKWPLWSKLNSDVRSSYFIYVLIFIFIKLFLVLSR